MSTRARWSIPVVMIFTASLGGCGTLGNIINVGGSSSRAYDITTNRSSYNRGNVGDATIRNTTDETVEYNLCPRRLERQVDRNWISVFEWPTAGSACTTDVRTLRRGESVNTFFDIPTGVSTGTYRVVFTGLAGPNRATLTADQAATESFAVR